MKRSTWIVLFPLFLLLLVGISWVSCCDSANIGNSVQSKFGSVLNSEMAPKNVTRGMKRLLEQSIAGNYESGDRLDRGRTEYNRIRSKRWKTMFHPQIAEGSNQCQNENQFRGDGENTTRALNEGLFVIREDTSGDLNQNSFSQCPQTNDMTDQCSQSFGQAIYQRSKQGLIVRYKDSGDNIYKCDDCNACFWFGEAVKRSSSNASLIYTNCCRKGQIKVEQPKPTLAFLENLLNPDNGSESKLFRENVKSL